MWRSHHGVAEWEGAWEWRGRIVSLRAASVGPAGKRGPHEGRIVAHLPGLKAGRTKNYA